MHVIFNQENFAHVISNRHTVMPLEENGEVKFN